MTMSESRTMQLRELIRNTKRQPNSLASLQALVAQQIGHLHTAIRLPAKNPQGTLTDFVIRYIDHVPNFIDALRGMTKEAGIYNYTSVFLSLAEEFFINPPKVLQAHNGVLALLGEAYIAHRLIEEVNDRVVAHCGIPLAPMDMTRANLIVHELLGEQFANELDFVVHYSTEVHIAKEALMDNPTFNNYIALHKQQGWAAELDRWPCLAENLSINLEFDSIAGTKPVLH